MTAIAYLYLPTPPLEDVGLLLSRLVASGITITHFGPNDPPQRWAGDVPDMATVIAKLPEKNKWAFFRDGDRGIELSLTLHYDPRWVHSDLNFSIQSTEEAEALASALSAQLNPYLCICGINGGGKDQFWKVLHERDDCPESLRVGFLRA
jgi:hypothetical protein